MSDPYQIGALGIELIIDELSAEPSLEKRKKMAWYAAYKAISEMGAFGLKSIGQYANIVTEDRFGKIDWGDPVWLEG